MYWIARNTLNWEEKDFDTRNQAIEWIKKGTTILNSDIPFQLVRVTEKTEFLFCAHETGKISKQN